MIIVILNYHHCSCEYCANIMNLINIDGGQINFSDFKLIIPSVSVGNVPQLTVDLLITTFDFKRVSTIWHPAILSSIGSDPYYSNISEIYTACELYINEELKLATIQIRSTVENKLAVKFFNDLRGLVQHLNFKHTFILSSAFDYELHNVLSEKFYFVSTSENNEVMEINHIKPLQPALNGKYCLNGGGFAVKLFQTLQQTLSCTLLIKYVSEGDNRPDAVMMLQRLFAVLGTAEIPQRIKCPSSWQFVFGGPPPLGIY
ncbi:proteasome assembly chaperone 2 [Anoplophora glabripennis]|uniref:proteasome assembly chaperone 2 n=1 Tax=Anoplophora glabripennis TaxID=217634 RepID=UPI000874869A|nr:proteasome assembly chaperone 2 [Anoplophora glabripennis]